MKNVILFFLIFFTLGAIAQKTEGAWFIVDSIEIPEQETTFDTCKVSILFILTADGFGDGFMQSTPGYLVTTLHSQKEGDYIVTEWTEDVYDWDWEPIRTVVHFEKYEWVDQRGLFDSIEIRVE